MTRALRHAQQRARQRHGLRLTIPDLRALAERCAALGDQVLVIRRATEDNPRAILLVTWKGRALPLVYCTEARVIVTFLPRNWRITNRHSDPNVGKRRDRKQRARMKERRRRVSETSSE